jgi:hypothetical protein
VVIGTATIRPIDPTIMATICSATASELIAGSNDQPPSENSSRTGRDAPA